ncbi:hypothetical protein O3P69_003966 [Scylla paramamosain]|uniref:protein-tyrosine-phosphatase n=1 Tax=Scylla paramamosain TaxID=85552 RepID=A0AAW0UEA5_SCYPA
MARPPSLWVLVLAICGGLEGATAVTTAADSSTPTTADSFHPSTTDSFHSSTADSSPQFTTDSISSTADSSPQFTTDSIPSTADSSPQFTTDSTPSTADSSPQFTTDSTPFPADSFPQFTTDSSPPSTTDSFHSSTADSSPPSTPDSIPSTTNSFHSSTADSSPPSTTDSIPFNTNSFHSFTADSSPPSTTDFFISSTTNPFHPSTTDSSPPSTTDFFISSTTDPFLPSTTHSFSPTSKASIPDASSGSSTFSNGTFLTTERNKRDDVQSGPKEIYITLNSTTTTGVDKISVSWNDVNCTEGYEMQGNCERNYNCCSDQCELPLPYDLHILNTTFSGDPCTTYEVKVKGINCKSSWSEERSISINCKVPDKPRNLKVTKPAFDKPENESRMAYITWNTPYPTNGTLMDYELTYSTKNTTHNFKIIPDEHCNDESTRLTCNYSLELKPESEYCFTVKARNKETSANYSLPETVNLTTEAGKPFFTSNKSLDYEKNEVTHNSITLLIDGNSISHDNGKIKKCLVKMKEGCDGKNGQSKIVYCTNNVPNAQFRVVIGKNSTSSGCLAYDTFSSLESSECYKFFVTILTSMDSEISNTVKIITKQNPLIPVLYSLVALFIILLIGAVVTYVIFRHHYRPIQDSISIELPLVVPSPPDISVERRILLSDLLATVQRLFSNGSAGLATEYGEIQALRTFKPCKNAHLPVNRIKTRYLNILPFDETRVVLKEYPNIIGSDFINASYVHGYSMAREFIACQGPLHNTVGDFWRMVWEKDVHVIVMVTQCVERNKEKCCKYWPDNGKSLSFGDLTLKVRNLEEKEHHEDGFIQRNLQLSKRHKIRSIHHFHFVSWPDMGCPDTPDQLIKFVKTVKAAVPAASAHVVVHCSAGVGRTGTFIGLSNLIEEMHEQDSIDVFHTVYRMRLYRTNMVQTQVQYSFLYKCVLKYYLDQKGESESWSAIERRLGNPESIPDVITGALRGPQHDKFDEGDITYSTSEESISQDEKEN